MHEPAVLQHIGAIGDAQHMMHVLLDDEDRVPLLAQVPDHLEQELDIDRREALGRLVEQQHARLGHQRPADRQHLLLAAAERAGDLLRRSASTGRSA